MTENPRSGKTPSLISRRQALKSSSLAAVTGLIATAAGSEYSSANEHHPFHGQHQQGIVTRQQSQLAFGVFDITTTSKQELLEVLREWSLASELLIHGRSLGSLDPAYPPIDTGETEGVESSALTLTFGIGPSVFDGRFGLGAKRPRSLVNLPAFPGDRLDPLRTGGDLCIQACANDATVSLHAVRNLARIGVGVVAMRSLQLGAGQTSSPSRTSSSPRNLLGFRDGTNNLSVSNHVDMDQHVWVGAESDQPWMVGGTYLVARRIRIHLEEWSSLPLETQQISIGRFRSSGAPLSGHKEHDKLDFRKLDIFGAPVITANAHVRVSSAEANNGAVILRRGFNFADGVDPRTGELDAGLMFICFQRDPRGQFIALQTNIAANDALSRYTTHVGSGIFACPPGATRGEFVGQHLFD
jgi:deferrochelatase/peroxidase EfeB